MQRLLSDAQGVQGSLGGAEQDATFSIRFLVNRMVGTGCSAQAGIGHREAFPLPELPGGPQGHGAHCQALQSLPRKLAAAEKLLNVLVV